MSRRRAWVGAAGAAAVGLYLAGVLIGARLGPLSRQPLLDGLAGPPPYRWVDPPSSLAATNTAPSSARATVDLDPQSGSAASVLTTDDGQASLALGIGSIPPLAGETQAVVTITPLAAKDFPAPPGGREVAGNVYRIAARYGGGQALARMGGDGAQVVLEYPATPGTIFTHTLLVSSDGKTWRAVSASDARGQQLVQASVTSFGYVAVGRSGGEPQHGAGIASLLPWIVLAVVVLLLVLVFARAELRRRATRGRGRPPS